MACGIRRFNFRLLLDVHSHRENEGGVHVFKCGSVTKKMFSVKEWNNQNGTFYRAPPEKTKKESEKKKQQPPEAKPAANSGIESDGDKKDGPKAEDKK